MRTKPKCNAQTSTPCGYACISKQKRCTDSLSGNALRLGLAMVAMAEQTNLAARSKDVGKSPTEDESKALYSIKDFLSQATQADMLKYAQSNSKNDLTEEEVLSIADAYVNALDKQRKTYLAAKGAPKPGTAWTDDGVPTKSYTHGRARAIAAVYIRQGGLDGYTGLPLKSIAESDLDHITPGIDSPDNWILTSPAVNVLKSDRTLSGFSELIDKTATDPSYAKRQASLRANYSARSTAARDLLKDKPKDSWTDAEIDKLGTKYYYVGRHLGTSITYSRPGNRKSTAYMPTVVGKPLAKQLAAAYAAKDSELIAKAQQAIQEASKRLTEEYLAK